jgi:hypothetical protein
MYHICDTLLTSYETYGHEQNGIHNGARGAEAEGTGKPCAGEGRRERHGRDHDVSDAGGADRRPALRGADAKRSDTEGDRRAGSWTRRDLPRRHEASF